MRLSVINVLWIVFNLPICYLIFSLLYADDQSFVLTLILSIMILAPFLFFPATTAMFGVARKWIMGDLDVPLFKSFWTFYKENYLRSMSGGLIFTLIWFIWGVDFYYFSKINIVVSSIFIGLLFFLFLFTINFFANTVHTELSLKTSIKNSFFLTLVFPLNNLLTIVVNGIIFYLSLATFTFLIPFFMGSLIAIVSFSGYYQKVEKIHGDKKDVTEK